MAEDVVGLRYVSEGLSEALAGLGQYHQAIQRVGTQQKASAQATGTSTRATQRATTTTRQAAKAEDDWFKIQRQRVAIMRGSEAIAARQAREMERLSRSMGTTAAATTVATTAQMRLRQSFLQTANSIAILDGPLGGIASRFSAFGVLLGRAGFIMAGFLVTTALLGTVIGRGVRAFTEWEAQTARINAVLATTGHQVGLTTGQIESMASRIALATLESEQGVRAAAARLLTFGGIAGDTFEGVLQAATDMAALGFGTVESEAVKLAKALEDPAQALTSLSRAGIVFTRQQRALIISLVESGQQAEAMERILANVNARVGGAAEAAARGTMAGSFDTIAQAASRAVRELGGVVVEFFQVRRFVEWLADISAPFAAGPSSLDQQLAEARALLAERQATLERRRGGRNEEAAQRYVNDQMAVVAALRQRIQADEDAAAAARANQQIQRDAQAIDDLRAETDLRRQLVGLSEEESRVQRSLAELGLRNLDIQQRLRDAAPGLAAQGLSLDGIVAELDRYEAKLQEVAAAEQDAFDVSRLEAVGRELRQSLTNMEQQNSLSVLQLNYMQQGVAAAEARRRAEEDLSLQMAATVLNAAGLPTAARDAAMAFVDSVLLAQNLRDALAEAQERLDMSAELANTLDGLDEQNELMAEQLRLLDEGVDFSESLRRAEVNLAIQRANTLATTASTTEEMERQLAIAAALADSFEENVQLAAAIESRRPARTRRGGDGRQREEITLEGLVEDRAREIAQARELLQLSEQERLAAEIRFDLINRLRQANVAYSEEAVTEAANRLAAEQQLNEELERQEQIRERLAQGMANLFTAALRGADAFKNALSNLLSQLAQMLANRAFQSLLSGSMGGGKGGGLLGLLGMLFSADGNAFNAGRVVPFANGGVVGSPTMFPMAGGRTGVMGEAGPEAIMPLRRGKGGKLGVASAPQNVNVSVDVRAYVDDNGNWAAKVENISDARIRRQAPAIATAARDSTLAVIREVGPGRIR